MINIIKINIEHLQSTLVVNIFLKFLKWYGGIKNMNETHNEHSKVPLILMTCVLLS